MSTFGLILIIVGALLLALFIGGFIASRRRVRPEDFERHVAAADQALAAAAAADRGWDRELLEKAARDAVASQRQGFAIDALHLVLVDDRPGVEDDRAHLVATGSGGEVSIVLTREPGGSWVTESVSG